MCTILLKIHHTIYFTSLKQRRRKQHNSSLKIQKHYDKTQKLSGEETKHTKREKGVDWISDSLGRGWWYEWAHAFFNRFSGKWGGLMRKTSFFRKCSKLYFMLNYAKTRDITARSSTLELWFLQEYCHATHCAPRCDAKKSETADSFFFLCK